jgi:hypothetical protein
MLHIKQKKKHLNSLLLHKEKPPQKKISFKNFLIDINSEKSRHYANFSIVFHPKFFFISKPN